jgi:2-polyprenyl-6-methoxyphenol hydroxylase-like FAD-dependent oxidoreductase
MSPVRPRIVVAGAGIAGSLIATGLKDRSDIELICLERVPADAHMDAGTGLNVGPNAIKSLRSIMPERADTIVANSFPWQRWQISLTDGRPLMDLRLADVADNDGIRIRWAELYALLRQPLDGIIQYGAEVIEVARSAVGVSATLGNNQRIEDIDLLIGGDGRYSKVRDHFYGEDPPNFLGVCLYRVLFPAGENCPIDDYGQWFNGPNRLLAFRVPGDFVYCAGSFPLPTDGIVTDVMKLAPALRAAYWPVSGEPSEQAAYLIDAVQQYNSSIHWARLQDGTVRYAGEPNVLLVGDSAHPMVPTLGQGATQAVEDACVVVDEIRKALDAGRTLDDVPERVEARRRERVQFVVDFSRDATDTMLAGADPVSGSLKKTEPAFQDKLRRLYRDVPVATQ